MKKISKILALMLIMAMLSMMVVGCGGGDKPAETPEPAETTETAETEETTEPAEEEPAEPVEEEPAETAEEEPATVPIAITDDFEAVEGTVAMITDVGGINDESFNQSSWNGLEALQERGATVSFIESQKEADYEPNLDTKITEGNDLIWGVGFMMKGAVEEASLDYPEQKFALIDDFWDDGALPNVTGVTFAAEESSFLVGYIASYMTETDRVGLVLGKESPTMNGFTNGYFAGVHYGAKEQGKEIQTDYVVIESFGDSALGKATANKMFFDGCDIVFHAAGGAGIGVIEAAKEMDKWAIGVDLDQNYLAPDNVLTSALKNVNVATESVSAAILRGEDLGGKTVHFGLVEGGVGIAPSSDKHVPADILAKTAEVEEKIIAGEIVVPKTAEGLEEFKK